MDEFNEINSIHASHYRNNTSDYEEFGSLVNGKTAEKTKDIVKYATKSPTNKQKYIPKSNIEKWQEWFFEQEEFMIKKILLYILIIFLFSANQVIAENWIPVQADNGKTTEFDIDSLVLTNNIARYRVKQRILEEDKIFNMVTNFNNKTSAICDIEIIDYTGKRKFESYSSKLKYLPIRKGSLNQALYQFLIYLKESNINDVSSSRELKKYITKLQKKIQGSWHPNNLYELGYSQPDKKAIAYVTLFVHKNGNIYYVSYQNNTNTKHDEFN